MMETKTTCPCRECGQPMQSYVQELAEFQVQRGRCAQVYVTCATESCKLEGFTFLAETYPQRDLREYLK